MDTLFVFGAGGFALQIIGILKDLAARGTSICFVADEGPDQLYEIPVVRPAKRDPSGSMVIAIADSAVRRKIAENVACSFTTLRASSAIISEHASIGEGSILCDNVIIEAGARIGRHFQCNIYSYVAHECVVGDYVTFAPRVSCNGNVHIGDGVYIGTGAVIKQGTSNKPLVIGAGSVIGMGAIVTKDVPPGATVVGNPAKPLPTMS